MMREEWERFRALPIAFDTIGLEAAGWEDGSLRYFCTPVNAEVLGGLGVDGIHFVFLPDDEAVYCVSPMAMEEGRYVLPVAETVQEFFSFVLYCRDASPLEQLGLMGETQFQTMLREDADQTREGSEAYFSRKEAALTAIADSLGVRAENPYAKVKAMQERFDSKKLRFSDEYYDVLGIEREN